MRGDTLFLRGAAPFPKSGEMWVGVIETEGRPTTTRSISRATPPITAGPTRSTACGDARRAEDGEGHPLDSETPGRRLAGVLQHGRPPGLHQHADGRAGHRAAVSARVGVLRLSGLGRRRRMDQVCRRHEPMAFLDPRTRHDAQDRAAMPNSGKPLTSFKGEPWATLALKEQKTQTTETA